MLGANVNAVSSSPLATGAGGKLRTRSSAGRWAWVQRGLLLGGAVGLVLLIRSLPHADWAALVPRVGPAFPLLAAIAIGWMALYARGLRTVLNDAVGWGRLLKNRFLGEAYNVVMPLGDVGGDPLRVMDLGAEIGTANAVRAIVFDRLVYAASGFLFSGVTSAVAVVAFAWDARFERLVVAYVAVALVAAVVTSLLATRARTAIWIGRLLRLLRMRVPELPSPLPARTFVRALGWNLAGRAGVMAEIAVLLFALGQHVRLDAVVAIAAILAIAGIIFTFIPNGLGVNEGAAVLALSLTGYGETVGLAVGLVRRVRQLVLVAAGVALHAFWQSRRRPSPRPAGVRDTRTADVGI